MGNSSVLFDRLSTNISSITAYPHFDIISDEDFACQHGPHITLGCKKSLSIGKYLG